MNCPHCGGLIEIVAAKPPVDHRQRELPLLVELNLPPTKKLLPRDKKNLALQNENLHAGAPAAHDHDHDHDLKKSYSKKHEHDHDHGGLTPAEQDLLDQVNELVAVENRAKHFETIWMMRIREYPVQVFAAIGEARSAKREGRVRRSIGGILNWQFKKFRESAAQRKAS
jgi:hypothetical protein